MKKINILCNQLPVTRFNIEPRSEGSEFNWYVILYDIFHTSMMAMGK